jgi:ABC-type antimicrobial peptide transport system permease subunit
MVYFGLGILASIAVIIIEASTHQMSIEIGENFNPIIIYLGLSLFIIALAGIFTACYIGYYHAKKSLKNRKD